MLVGIATTVALLPTAMRAPAPRMNLFDNVKNLVGGAVPSASSSFALDFESSAPAWDELRSTLDAASTAEERAFRTDLESGRIERASALAKQRLFDLPDGEEPRVTLYRDTAAWCPYCEKVWLTLEEKKVPYKVDKVNMNCYGDKPGWFWDMQPSGGIPVARVDASVIKESNDIIFAIEDAFPDIPLLPPQSDPQYQKARELLGLERELFSCWFRWLTSSMSDGAQRVNMESLFGRVEAALAESGGPFFLGGDVSLVDCFFAPFLERMAASLPYYKGLLVRRNPEWPNIEQWFVSMEARPSYRHIQSDFYTHVHDLPPQIGRCHSSPGSEAYAAAIDGTDGSWSLPLPEDDDSYDDAACDAATVPQPLGGLGLSADAARREAAERLIANPAAVAKFAARGLCGPGFPPVSAELSDPNAEKGVDAASLPLVEALLQHTAHSLLAGPDASKATLSSGVDPRTAAASLGYLRDRISVPRDMSYPAARQLRAHLNGVIEAVGAKAAGGMSG